MAEDTLKRSLRVSLCTDSIEKLSREDLIKCLVQHGKYVEYLESKVGTAALEAANAVDGSSKPETSSFGREPEERLRQQQLEATRRENVLVMRLTTKEQEVHDYLNQLEELKASVAGGYRSSLLDPAVNVIVEKLRSELVSAKERVEQSQQELNAWKFTPDSNTGKRLMAKCRMLYQENEELGKMISSGRVAKLEGDVALAKTFIDEMKRGQTDTDELLVELAEDLEGLQSTIYQLQQQLKDCRASIKCG